MKLKYKKYKIKEGDTLASISKLLGKPTLEVKNFHNIFCDHDNFIVLDFPDNFKELFIYPEYSEVDLNPIPKVFFDGGSKLLFRPISKKTNFGVQYTMTSGEEINTIKFETSVYFKGKSQDNLNVFEIDRISKTFVNDEETSIIADELAEKVASVLYPLEIIVDENGKWQEVFNHEEIANRWPKIREKILEEYEGEWVENYLELSETSLLSQNNLTESLSKDWFLNAYFGGIYVNYNSKLICKKDENFPILPNISPANYEVKQKIEEYLDDYKLINIETIGVLSDVRSKSDFEGDFDFPYYSMLNPEEEKAVGKFRAKYFLKPNNHQIESMFLECSIDLEIPRKVEIVVSVL